MASRTPSGLACSSGSSTSFVFPPPPSLAFPQSNHQPPTNIHNFLVLQNPALCSSLAQASLAQASPATGSALSPLQPEPSKPSFHSDLSSSNGTVPTRIDIPLLSEHQLQPTPSSSSSSSSSPPSDGLTGTRRRKLSTASMDEYIRIGLERLSLYGTRNIYSQTGFDLVGALARVERRPNPQILLGPVDTSTAIVVVDARQQDFPIVFATPSFSSLTGYNLTEILGRNCRFLQYRPNDPRHLKQRRISYISKSTSIDFNPKESINNRPLQTIKRQLSKGEESQSALVNYRKDGHAFVNLLTVVPITWDSPEVAYFVGFQINVVEQTDLIFHQVKSKDFIADSMSQPTASIGLPSECHLDLSGHQISLSSSSTSGQMLMEDFQKHQPIDSHPNEALETPPNHPATCGIRASYALPLLGPRTVLEEHRDLILAVSLKGRLFYVSQSSQNILGYQPEELIHQNISKICHGTDLTMILRQLKEIGNTANTPIELNFRAIRKDQSLVWMEFEGKLHLEPGKGRKYLVIAGPQREIGKLSWKLIETSGHKEFWMRLSRNGLCLFCTNTVEKILGYPARMMIGRSLAGLSRSPEEGLNILESIVRVEITGQVQNLKHFLTRPDGQTIRLSSRFYPSYYSKDRGGQIKQLHCQSRWIEEGEDEDQNQNPGDQGYAYDDSQDPKDIIQLKTDQENQTELNQNLANDLTQSFDFSNTSTAAIIDQHQQFRKMIESNLFSALETDKTTTWNLELSELKRKNRMLKNELISKGLIGLL